MKEKLRLSESDLVRLIRKVINEQVTRQYTRQNPLIIPNDPYVYAYETSPVNNLYAKLKTEKNPYKWRAVNPNTKQKAYCSIYYKYGHILEMPEQLQTRYCSNLNRDSYQQYSQAHN
jgi:hypothetical protein